MRSMCQFRNAAAAPSPPVRWLSAHMPDTYENRNGSVLLSRTHNLTGIVGELVRSARKPNCTAVPSTPGVLVAHRRIGFEGRSEDE
jgi:hypothetical protein